MGADEQVLVWKTNFDTVDYHEGTLYYIVHVHCTSMYMYMYIIILFGQVKIFRFWPKTLDYSLWFLSKCSETVTSPKLFKKDIKSPF